MYTVNLLALLLASLLWPTSGSADQTARQFEDALYARLKAGEIIDAQDGSYVLCADDVQDHHAIRLILKKFNTLFVVQDAELRVDAKQRVLFIHAIGGEVVQLNGESVITFEKETIKLSMPSLK